MIKLIKRLFKKEGAINRIWYEDGRILMHVNTRSGAYYVPVKDGAQYSYWLVDYHRTMRLPKDETIYQLMEVKDKMHES